MFASLWVYAQVGIVYPCYAAARTRGVIATSDLLSSVMLGESSFFWMDSLGLRIGHMARRLKLLA